MWFNDNSMVNAARGALIGLTNEARSSSTGSCKVRLYTSKPDENDIASSSHIAEIDVTIQSNTTPPSITLSSSTPATASGSGTVTYAALCYASDTTRAIVTDCGTSGTEVIVNTTSLVSGVTSVDITDISIGYSDSVHY